MERLLQFIWKHRLGLRESLKTTDGRRVCVINEGVLNEDAGPDFFNATVEIGDETWVGNVEIHVNASDWYRHGHDRDLAYDSVILHVVQVDDAEIRRSNGSLIPQMVVRCSAEAARRCNDLVAEALISLPCENTIKSLPEIYISDWLTSLGAERLYNKSSRVQNIVEYTKGHWEAAAYITFARGLGFGLNSDAFERLAIQMPLRILSRHRDEFISVEALLYGRAGLIPDATIDEDPYTKRLREEYAFMAHRYDLPVGDKSLGWRMARTRPQNSPHRRIAMLSSMVQRGFHLMGDLLDADSLDDLRNAFRIELMGFWTTHYNFNARGGGASALSDDSIERLVVNVAIPLLHAYATKNGEEERMSRCIDWLEEIKGERNRVTQLFESVGIKCCDALRSQAVIELRREYCEKKKCIYCRFGHRMLSAEISK